MNEQIERLQADYDAVKSERDLKSGEYQEKFEKEREAFIAKKRDVEKKYEKIENNQTAQMLNHEREKAKWEQENTYLMTQKEDYKHENELCKKKIEQQVKDIERLRNDLKNAKKSAFNPAGAFMGG